MPIIEKAIVSIVIFVATLLLANTAYAYIDPGTGSMMIQAVIAVIAVIGVSVGVTWGRIKNIINRVLGRKIAGKEKSSNEK